MPPAARVTDMHTCPMVTVLVPHVGGPILPPGVPTVLIGFLPAATVTDMLVCVGPPDMIAKGSAGVKINYLPAARMGDMTAHGGVIVAGLPTVMIGEIGAPAPGAAGASAVTAGLAAAGLHKLIAAIASMYGKPLTPAQKAPVKIPPECAYLKKQFRAEGTPANFDANRRKATIGAAKKIKYTFPGAKAPVDATSTPVTIGGHTVDVIQAASGPAEKDTVLPSTNQIASSLGAVPANQYGYIKNVVASPDPNPADAYWAKQYNMPGFRSEATAGADGTVDWYPIPKNVNMIPDETMIHESGHAYSKNIWPKDSDWKGWQDAMKSDARDPSDYAKSSKDEDFSESLVMYSMSKGTKCEATAKALYPARYKILDDLLQPKPAK